MKGTKQRRKERVVVSGLLLLLGTAGYSNSDRPNIVFVYSDDHGPWAIGLEHPNAHTPNIDRLLGNDGARLTNAFVTTPVCSLVATVQKWGYKTGSVQMKRMWAGRPAVTA